MLDKARSGNLGEHAPSVKHWRIVPKASGSDSFKRRFPTEGAAKEVLAQMSSRIRLGYRVEAFTPTGKRVRNAR